VCKNCSLMLSFGRSGSSWGKMRQTGSSWGEKVITPKSFLFDQLFFYLPHDEYVFKLCKI